MDNRLYMSKKKGRVHKVTSVFTKKNKACSFVSYLFTPPLPPTQPRPAVKRQSSRRPSGDGAPSENSWDAQAGSHRGLTARGPAWLAVLPLPSNGGADRSSRRLTVVRGCWASDPKSRSAPAQRPGTPGGCPWPESWRRAGSHSPLAPVKCAETGVPWREPSEPPFVQHAGCVPSQTSLRKPGGSIDIGVTEKVRNNNYLSWQRQISWLGQQEIYLYMNKTLLSFLPITSIENRYICTV